MSTSRESRTLYKTETGLWEIVIGLEIHAQVVSKAKLFSGAATTFAASPNTQVSPIDAAMPGMLPVINEFCVHQAVKTGLGLNAEIHLFSRFDRKNYFYPDLPAGYQISQLYHPIVGEGFLTIDLDDGTTQKITIERLHLEQDAGKSIHDLAPDHTFIDLNRCGIALMEIVTKPDLRSAEEVMAFMKKIRMILRYLGTSDGNMEEGSLRADVNISVRRPGEPLGTRAEIKNVNSIRFIGQAIAHEVERQIEIIEEGGKVKQETRLYDPSTGKTRSMRSKEDAQDYRYHPDPDLLPLRLTMEFIEEVRATLPELPDDKRDRFIEDYGLPRYDANILVTDIDTPEFFEQAVTASKIWQKGAVNFSVPKLIANWLISEVFAALNKENLSITRCKISPEQLASLVDLILEDVISGRIAKDVFQEMWRSGSDPRAIVEKEGLTQITDTNILESTIESILAQNKNMVEQYLAGKEKLFGFFVGQVMKETGGKANPNLVNSILQTKLKKEPTAHE